MFHNALDFLNSFVSSGRRIQQMSLIQLCPTHIAYWAKN